MLDSPTIHGSPVSGARGNRLPAHPRPALLGLVPERDRLGRTGLCAPVIQTIQEARTGSTAVVVGFQRWCKESSLDRLSHKVGQCFPFYDA